ncbi:patatin-like phospholipase family protein [Clostridium sp. CTA-7]
MKTFKILAFDGGGIKGALSVEILSRVCHKYPGFLDEIDLFTGTSTGSIIAALLANNISIKDLNNLYSIPVAKKIFSPSHFNLIRPKFSNTNLKNIISNYFSDNLKISDLKKYIFIPAFDVKGVNKPSWEPVFFNNLSKNSTSDFSVKDVILASSAAPTYFPSYKDFIDGGVIANSPTAISLLATLSAFGNTYDFKQIRLLSIGTGDSPERIKGKTEKWGILQWSFHPFTKMKSPLLSLLMDGMSDLENMYCKEFLKSNYFRINPRVSKFIEMDNYRFIPYLKSIASNYDLSTLYSYIENIYLK